MFDRDTKQCSGFVIESLTRKIYFLGDSDYSDIFKLIGHRLGPFDLSLIRIGASDPEWFMGPIHISPDQAAQVHLDTQSKHSVLCT